MTRDSRTIPGAPRRHGSPLVTLKRSRPALAVRSAVLGAAIAALPALMLHAPGAAAQGGQPLTVDLPAGPLDEALGRFARSSNVNLSYDPAWVEGKTAPAVSGTMTAQQAMDRLLLGSGLRAVPRAGGGYQLQRVAADQAINLGPLRVTAGVGTLGAVTEDTGSYTTGSTNTATRLPLSPRETPQTVKVVTRRQMDDFVMTDLDDVLESTSGVHVFDRGANGAFYYSRGFPMQAQYDGLYNPAGIGEWNQNPSPDSAVLDHIEVIQGASGLLTGAGEVGGLINLVRKRPTREFKAHVEALAGSWDKQRLVGDVSGALTESGAVRARAVAVYDDQNSFIDYVFDEKTVFYGALDADLTPTTTLVASVHYQNNDGRKPSGVPMGPDGSDLHLGRSTYIGNADASHEKEFTLYTLGLEQRLPGDWLLKASYNDNTTDVDIENSSYPTGGPLDVQTGAGLRLMQARHLRREFKSNAWDLHASGPLPLFGRRHELVIGANGYTLRERTCNSGPTPIDIDNIYAFDPRRIPGPPGACASLGDDDETEQYGAYAVTRINLADSLKFIAGGRVSWYEYTDPEGAQLRKETGEFSPYAGLLYDLNRQLTAYVSYSEIFTPQAERSRTGTPIEPIVGKNYEIGVKGEFRDGRLNAAAALFRLEQTNLPLEDEAFGENFELCGGICYIAQDEVVSEGVDLSVDGELLDGWNVGVGYTYSESEYDTGAQKGDPFRTEVPKNLFRAYTTYRIGDTGWTVGGNLNIQSRFYTEGVRSGIDWRVEQGGLALVGLMATYDVSDRLQIGLRADNLFDRRYFASTNSLYYIPYGEPRKYAISARYSFD